eukprot:10185372-Alexandrium_andersonii.AAC.1
MCIRDRCSSGVTSGSPSLTSSRTSTASTPAPGCPCSGHCVTIHIDGIGRRLTHSALRRRSGRPQTSEESFSGVPA